MHDISAHMKLAKYLGMKIRVGKERDTIRSGNWSFYDGSVLHVSNNIKETDLEHEIGHWITSTKGQRKSLEFGSSYLGPIRPSEALIKSLTGLKISDKMINDSADDSVKLEPMEKKQEALASIAGVAVTFALGNDWKKQATISIYKANLTWKGVMITSPLNEEFRLANEKRGQIFAKESLVKHNQMKSVHSKVSRALKKMLS
jgi:hypothetical protein